MNVYSIYCTVALGMSMLGLKSCRLLMFPHGCNDSNQWEQATSRDFWSSMIDPEPRREKS